MGISFEQNPKPTRYQQHTERVRPTVDMERRAKQQRIANAVAGGLLGIAFFGLLGLMAFGLPG